MNLALLRSHLQTKTGYAVHVGPLALTSKSLPSLTVTPIQDARADDSPDAGSWLQRWNRTLTIEGMVSASTGWDTALDTVLESVRTALARFNYPLETQSVVFYPPADNGQIAWFSMTIVWPYQVNYEE